MQSYHEVEYARTRLLETIVSYRGFPVLVESIDNSGLVGFKYIRDLRKSSCSLNELDINPLPLGYCNYNRYAFYLTRMPMRHDWKQGLRNKNILIADRDARFDFPYEVLHNTIVGEYPTFNKALHHLKSGVYSMAFSRNFAINEKSVLLYKGSYAVGTILEKNDFKPVLDDKFAWLSESLQEELELAA